MRLPPALALLVIGCAAGSACTSKTPPKSAPPVPLDPACSTVYRNLFAPPTLEILVAFGYKDAAPARFVGDRYERAVFVHHITKACNPKLASDRACGFDRRKDDADLFEKTMVGPDGKNKLIRVQVTTGSVGPDDKENRSNPLQKWQSEYAQKTFQNALQSASVVLYNGHSRDGGGPDFSPARLGAGGHPDYDWYREHEPGVRLLQESLDKAKNLRLLGLFSCASSYHFRDTVMRTHPGLGVISSQKLLYFSDALDATIQALSGILGMKCHSDLTRAMNTRTGQNGVNISGFFSPTDR